MKTLKRLALRYNAAAYIYAAGVILLMAAPLAAWWVLLYMIFGGQS